MKAGFAQIDISPDYFPIRTYFGQVDNIIDPIFAHAAVFDDGIEKFAFLSLDIVIAEWEYVNKIRDIVAANTDILPSNLMVSTTHNHACPAVVERGHFKKEEPYIETMIQKGADAVISAWERREPVVCGVASGYEDRVSYNRRYIRRDGTVITQPLITPTTDEILCCEGPIDPEVATLCVKNMDGKMLGVIVNFSAHANRKMGNVSSDYPGIIYKDVKDKYGADCVFLCGACGNINSGPVESTGANLASDVRKLIDSITEFEADWKVVSREKKLSLPLRKLDELEASVKNPSLFTGVLRSLVEKGWYDHSLELLRGLHKKGGHIDVIVQVCRLGKTTFASVPCEYFVEHQLRIKEKNGKPYTYIVTLANGWLGYIPTKEAFARKGGHETTTAFWSKMSPETGDILANTILELLKETEQV
ncbi:hypothetical protein M0P98_04630 [bacterium]|nr:hypothetical protein [bacterium]